MCESTLAQKELIALLGLLAFGACRSGGAPVSHKPEPAIIEGSAIATEPTAAIPPPLQTWRLDAQLRWHPNGALAAALVGSLRLCTAAG